jgi:hypothetical protein
MATDAPMRSDREAPQEVVDVSRTVQTAFQSQDCQHSKKWCAHFANNAANPHLPWNDSHRLSTSERLAIQESVQQFQLGEGSEGHRLLDRADVHSRASGDPYFREALVLFIKEEQRHSGYLLRFMLAQEIPAVTKHWVDSVFRFLRGLAGLELSLRVLVTAEIIAVPYYRALGRATKCNLLRSISAKIVGDEAAHLKFQASMLHRLARKRSPLVGGLVRRAQHLFLMGTCCVVWLDHGGVFIAAKYRFRRFLREACRSCPGWKLTWRSTDCAKLGWNPGPPRPRG